MSELGEILNMKDDGGFLFLPEDGLSSRLAKQGRRLFIAVTSHWCHVFKSYGLAAVYVVAFLSWLCLHAVLRCSLRSLPQI